MSEALFIKGMPDTTTCEIHEWSVEKIRRELVALMRARHGKGGVNVCCDCIERARGTRGTHDGSSRR